MGEDERGAGDVADFAGAGGDVLQGAPPAGEQGEPAFTQAAQRPLKSVIGAGADIQLPAAGRLFDWDVDADARTVISRVGQGGQARRGGLVERREGVAAG